MTGTSISGIAIAKYFSSNVTYSKQYENVNGIMMQSLINITISLKELFPSNFYVVQQKMIQMNPDGLTNTTTNTTDQLMDTTLNNTLMWDLAKMNLSQAIQNDL